MGGSEGTARADQPASITELNAKSRFSVHLQGDELPGPSPKCLPYILKSGVASILRRL